MVSRGEGPYLFDDAGKPYLNCGDAAVSCLGHNDPEVIGAIKRQLDTLEFAHTGFLTSEPAEALASKLAAHAPEGIDRVYLVSGGSEAVEDLVGDGTDFASVGIDGQVCNLPVQGFAARHQRFQHGAWIVIFQ